MPSGNLVAFLPWIVLKDWYSVTGVRFLRLKDNAGTTDPALADLNEPLNKILSGYVDSNGHPAANCTVATVDGVWNLDYSTQSDQVEWATSLLFFSAFASNQYFTQFSHYANSTAFRLTWQRFTDAEWIAIVSRRRDGRSTDGGYKHGEFKFNRPPQVRPNDAFVDGEFLAGLSEASDAGSTTAQRLRTALPFVELANTDDQVMSLAAELVLMASAFEHLLDAPANKYKLACQLGDLLDQYGSIQVKDVLSERPNILIDAPHEREQLKWWIHKKWIGELYQLRSKLAHHGTLPKTGWNAFEHLVMAAFVFPLVAKLMLAKEGHYALTVQDKANCASIDPLLRQTHWAKEQEPGVSVTSRWQVILHEAYTQALHADIVFEPTDDGSQYPE